jgi:methionyl-tRNA formyltransferase
MYIKVYAAHYSEEEHSVTIGKIVARDGLRIAVKGGWIDLEEIQLAGKRKMKAREVLNGLKLEENAHVR